MKAKLIGILIGAVLFCMIWAGVVLAQQLFWSTEVTVNVVSGNQSFEVYLDPGFTIPAESYDFGDVFIGSMRQYSFWVKGTGEQSVFVNARVSENISSWADYSVHPEGGNWVPPAGFSECQDGIGQYVLRIKINDVASVGSRTFTLEFFKDTP